MKDSYESFMSQLYATNTKLDFYCDFEKIQNNVAEIAISLNTLNYLIGKSNIEEAVEQLWKRDPKVFEILDILIATRREQKRMYLMEDKSSRPISDLFKSKEGVVMFLNDTGLANLLRQQKIKNLVDYVFGVETGLDSNARKNRSGHVMEDWVKEIFINEGIPFEMEVRCDNALELEDALGKDIKRFDFVVRTSKTTYLIEVNFYAGGGSKPTEVARAYSELSNKVNQIDGYKFVWITDGKGWNGVRAFREAYDEIPYIYNLTNIMSFIGLVRSEL